MSKTKIKTSKQTNKKNLVKVRIDLRPRRLLTGLTVHGGYILESSHKLIGHVGLRSVEGIRA